MFGNRHTGLSNKKARQSSGCAKVATIMIATPLMGSNDSCVFGCSPNLVMVLRFKVETAILHPLASGTETTTSKGFVPSDSIIFPKAEKDSADKLYSLLICVLRFGYRQTSLVTN